jgi:hypothetical protein
MRRRQQVPERAGGSRARSKTTGNPIVAVVYTVPVVSVIHEDSFEFGPDGKIVYVAMTGDSHIEWDSQQPLRRRGQRVFLDSEDNEVLEGDIEPVPEQS